MASSVWLDLAAGEQFSGQLIGPPASNIAAPPFTFAGDLTSGYASNATSSLALVTAGTRRLTVNTASVTSTLPFLGPDGDATAPGFSFSGDTNTGVYRIGSDRIGLAVGGSLLFDMNAGRVLLTNNLTFPDNTYDIGASGATRPRDFYLGRDAYIGSTVQVASYLRIGQQVKLTPISDGVLKVSNDAADGFTRLILGTNDASGVSWNKSTTTLEAKLGDGSAYTGIRSASILTSGGSVGSPAVAIGSSSDGFYEVSAGIVGMATGNALAHPAIAFASLPASPPAGSVAYVSDSNTVTWGATIAGGSTNKVLAFYNGTNWTVAGK